MISSLMLVNQKGEIVLYREYRDDVDRRSADAFRHQVVAKKSSSSLPPVKIYDGTTIMHTKHKDLTFLAMTKQNVNPSLVFQFLYQLIRIFKAYLGEKFTEGDIKKRFTLIYELLDEALDYGYPQNCSIDVLRLYINLGKVKTLQNADKATSSKLTSQITGAIDWRREGIWHEFNEVYLNVQESTNMLLSAEGEVLRSEVTGKIMMTANLSGMPECKLGLNDKVSIEDKENKTEENTESKKNEKEEESVAIEDCTFHRCVKLGQFETNRTVTFVPPDGRFELMRYRITENVDVPFRIIPVIEERGKSRVSYNLKVIGQFDSKLTAKNVVLKIPCPKNTAKAQIYAEKGKAKYDPTQEAIVWRISKFVGDQEVSFNCEVELMATVRESTWSRPPIQLNFNLPMKACSGLYVKFLRVIEKYHADIWMYYETKAGQYQIRI